MIRTMTRISIGCLLSSAMLLSGMVFADVSGVAPGIPEPNQRNEYPLVLVHGWIGWDRDELGGYKYWGGKQDLQEHLTNVKHYETHTAAVGPISSNWDRACELYAYLKGGRVDYGAAHAAKYGHDRFGRVYPGILRDWGTPGKHQKIHLITHSMGGQTARQLIQLLAEGDAAERQYPYKPEDSLPSMSCSTGVAETGYTV
jgi:triacylglycerol lipase